jgi:hypothetical protein
MDSNFYGLVEMLLFFGALLAFCFGQLYSLSQVKKRRLERERSKKSE